MRHFRQYQTKIPLETRQQIINYGSGLDLWQPTEVHKEWEIMNLKSPVEGLTIFPGFQSQYASCMKYMHMEDSIKTHYWTKHPQVAKEGLK